jgi:hypothetical protein
MAGEELTQEEADALLALEKKRATETRYRFPGSGGKLVAELVSMDEKERFHLDINRSSITLEKITFQNRARTVVILARLDLAGAPHRNPDDSELGCPHIHLYREGYGDKWAFEVPVDRFGDLEDRWRTLHDFTRFCNVVEPPLIERDLLS